MSLSLAKKAQWLEALLIEALIANLPLAIQLYSRQQLKFFPGPGLKVSDFVEVIICSYCVVV